MAEDASEADLTMDVAYLRKTWARIKESAQRLPPQSLLHLDLNLLQRVLRDLVSDHTQTIRVDSREQFEIRTHKRLNCSSQFQRSGFWGVLDFGINSDKSVSARFSVCAFSNEIFNSPSICNVTLKISPLCRT